ncbi:MAG: hypothetical protein LBJ00_04755 [Planctomycetaceae bacterium]|nr:hypothetical protein [Planctomycetaceae bacterium]
MLTYYTQAVLKLDTQAQQREAVVQGQSPLPYWLRYTKIIESENAGICPILSVA